MRRTRRSTTLVGRVALAAVLFHASIAAAEEVVEKSAAPKPVRAKHRHNATIGPTAASDGPQHGNASFYSKRLSGRKTASGEAYDPAALTAAHRTLPLGTKLKVVNPKNDKSVVVTINDRGPVPKNRVLDVSSAAADALGMKKDGVTKVETQVVGKTGPASEAASGKSEADAAGH